MSEQLFDREESPQGGTHDHANRLREAKEKKKKVQLLLAGDMDFLEGKVRFVATSDEFATIKPLTGGDVHVPLASVTLVTIKR